MYLFLEIDDIFVRNDLSGGKYKIDFQAAETFETYFFDGYEKEREKDELWLKFKYQRSHFAIFDDLDYKVATKQTQ